METFTTSIALCPAHAKGLRMVAAFYGLDVKEFLKRALILGTAVMADNAERAGAQNLDDARMIDGEGEWLN